MMTAERKNKRIHCEGVSSSIFYGLEKPQVHFTDAVLIVLRRRIMEAPFGENVSDESGQIYYQLPQQTHGGRASVVYVRKNRI